jgi:hypothetical protein
VIDDEPPVIKNIEFAEDFHGLFHPVWSRQCDNRMLHVKRAWEYRWKPELLRLTLCTFGRHQITKSWRREADEMNRGVGPWHMEFRCYRCGYKQPLT